MKEGSMSILEEFNESYIEAFPESFNKKYIPIECLHHGNETETLLAIKKGTDEKYIVKCYSKTHPAYAGTAWNQIKNLNCTGIVSYIEDFQDDKVRCYVREYIEGQTLTEKRRNSEFTEDEVIRYGQDICNILNYLHNQTPPLIHRDIKPDNIIVRPDGSICLIDFGTARTLKENASSDTEFAGTRGYAAPEQYGFKQTDEKSDIYSVGVLLNWMLYGTTKPNDQRETRLDKVIQKCLSFDPEKRFKSVTLLAKNLENYKKPVQIKKKSIRICVVLAVMVFCVIAAFIYRNSRPTGITFQEPVIEKAVREVLGRESGAITKDDMASIKELYIGKDVIYKDMDSYYSAGLGDTAEHGTIECLDDLAYMVNLETICIGQESIKDISGLSNLEYLDTVQLWFNYVEDISALENKEYLTNIGLNSNPLTDISPLVSCPALISVDLRDTGDNYDGSPIAEMNQAFALLDVSGASDCYQHLEGKTVNTLKLGGSRMTNLECMKDMNSVYNLDISYSKITDISALKDNQNLMSLSMILCNVDDLSMLTTLPGLETVTLSETMKDKIAALGNNINFTVNYQ